MPTLHLNSIGFEHISQILQTNDGKNFIKIDDNKLLYLIKYIEGKHPDPTIETYKELGRITGILHKVKNFPFKTDFDADIVIMDLKKNADKFKFGKEYHEILNNLPSFQNLPQTLIHTDVSLSNTIVNENGTFILIDWDEAGIGTTVLDAGHPLINQFISEDLDVSENNIQAFYRSYFQINKLSNNEMKYIFNAGLFWACMYITYGNTHKRWQRIQWANKNRTFLENIIKSCLK